MVFTRDEPMSQKEPTKGALGGLGAFLTGMPKGGLWPTSTPTLPGGYDSPLWRNPEYNF